MTPGWHEGGRFIEVLLGVIYFKSSIKFPWWLIYFKPIWGGGAGLSETGGLFNLETTMVTVLQKKKTIIQRGKAQVREVLGHAAEDQNQTSSW